MSQFCKDSCEICEAFKDDVKPGVGIPVIIWVAFAVSVTTFLMCCL